MDSVVPRAHAGIVVGRSEAVAGGYEAVVEADDRIPREQIVVVLETVTYRGQQ